MENIKGLLVGVDVSEEFESGYKLYFVGKEITDEAVWDGLGIYVSEILNEEDDVCVMFKGRLKQYIDNGWKVKVVLGCKTYEHFKSTEGVY